ncbi:MAG: tetraacyldisaccharide 4'-kinase [Rhodospirillaceae bacterium]|nr:tetraacyldisaccharide 4'-kinase [Rhodospirillaceae bacterium]
MSPPEFWSDPDDVLARVLEPVGRIVGAVTTWRAARSPRDIAPIPVVSVGGVTVGGAGKTPVAAAIADALIDLGARPAIVMRGYGGRLTAPTRVDPQTHTAADVGDEALMHAPHHPTYIARRRVEAARLAAHDGLTVAVLDDGHQHPGLRKDVSLVVIDGADPFGNGYCVPAGPLREAPRDALSRADAVVLVGDDVSGLRARLPEGLQVLRARLVPDAGAESLRGRAVVAFAGLARPDKFFRTLEEIGAQVVARYGFEDHHPYTDADIQPILDQAFRFGAVPVTTAKDAVKLAPDQRQQVDVVGVRAVFDAPDALSALLRRVLPGR